VSLNGLDDGSHLPSTSTHRLPVTADKRSAVNTSRHGT
jgi:hypothetical protein